MDHLEYDSEHNATVENAKQEHPDSATIETEKVEDGDNLGTTDDGKLVKEEEKDTGVVKLHVYTSYWRAVGGFLATSVLVALFLMQGKCQV